MRSLKVKCPTWDHVETFYRRKLRRGNILTIRVPFCPPEGAQITIGLELPEGPPLIIDGTVIGVKPSPDSTRATLHLSLYGFTAQVRSRLERKVAEERGEPLYEPEPTPAPPAPLPADAPVNELVEAPPPPDPSALGSFERGVFDTLQAELARVRSSAAHEVLRVAYDAGIAETREAYFALARRFHPDHFAQFRSAPVTQMAQDLFIQINAAYDRMRSALVEAGVAVAGPALAEQGGWLVALDDIDNDNARAEHDVREPDTDARPAARTVTESVARAALEAMAAGSFEAARETLAEALHGEPRNRRLRSLYHVCAGREANAGGRRIAAAAHFEAALAHDPGCAEASDELAALRRDHGVRAGGVYRRLSQ